MLACAEAGADVVDVCTDALAGLTSQPAIGALIGSTQGTRHDTGVDIAKILKLNTWGEMRRLDFHTDKVGGCTKLNVNAVDL